MEKTINIEGKNFVFKTHGGLPRFYRVLFSGRDIFKDIQRLTDEEDDGKFEALECIAFAMHKLGEPNDKRGIDEWLGQFSTFGIYEKIDDIIDLWNEETDATSDLKKNQEPQSENSTQHSTSLGV